MNVNYSTNKLGEAIEIFDRLGFVLIKGFASDEGAFHTVSSEVERYIECSSEFKQFLKDGNYTYYSNGTPTLWGLNNVVSFLSKKGLLSFRRLKIVETANRVLKGVYCSKLKLNRVHFQDNKELRKLAWHHDETDFNKALVANLYLQAEVGFRITTKNHYLNNRFIKAHKFGAGLFDLVSDFVVIDAEAGDLLLFNGKLLHQPYNKGERCHLHLAFGLTNDRNAVRDMKYEHDLVTYSAAHFEVEDRFFRNPYILRGFYFVKLVADFFERKLLRFV